MRLDPNQYSPDRRVDVLAVNTEFAAMDEALGLLLETQNLRLAEFLKESIAYRKKSIMLRIERLILDVEQPDTAVGDDPSASNEPSIDANTDDTYLIRLAPDSALESVITWKEWVATSKCGTDAEGIVKYVNRCLDEMAKASCSTPTPIQTAIAADIALVAIHKVRQVVMDQMIRYQVDLEQCRREEERESTSGEGK